MREGRPEGRAPRVLEWSPASYPPLRPHQENSAAGTGSMGLSRKTLSRLTTRRAFYACLVHS